MALTAAQYRDKAEAALNTANGQGNDGKLAWSNQASVYAFLYVEQAKIDAGFYSA